MRRLVWYTAVVLATLAAAMLFWQFRGALLLFVLSLAINAAVNPVADRLVDNRMPRWLALALIYGIGLMLLALTFIAISGALLDELQRATDHLATTYERIKTDWQQGSGFQQTVAQYLPPPDKLYEAISGEQGQALAQAILGFTAGIFGLLSDAAIILILSVYWGIDHDQFERLWLSLLPPEQRIRARNIWRSVETGVGSYIRSELVQSLLAGVALGLGFRLMGMPYPTLLAVAGALAWLLPWVGVLLAIIPVILIGLTVSPIMAVLSALYTFAIFLFLEALVEPRLFNRRRYSSILIVVVMIAMTDAFGIIGIVIAPPLAAAVQIFFNRLMRQPTGKPVIAHAEQLDDLRQRLVAVKLIIENSDDPPTPEAQSVLERLTRLVEESIQTPEAAEVRLSNGVPKNRLTSNQ